MAVNRWGDPIGEPAATNKWGDPIIGRSGPKPTSNPGDVRAQINPEPRESQYSAVGALKNVPGSTVQYAKDVTAPFTDPAKFVDAAKQLFTKDGLAAFKDHYVSKYGSVEDAMRTAYNDPAGFLSDMSGVGGLTKLATLPTKLVKDTAVGRVGAKVGQVADAVDALDPINLAAGTVGAGIAGVGNAAKYPQSVMDTNLKMSNANNSKLRSKAKRAEVVDTLLSNEIPLTSKGMSKLDDIITTRTMDLDNIIDAAEQSGSRIPIGEVMGPLKQLYKEMGDPLTNPGSATVRREIQSTVNAWAKDLMKQHGMVKDFTPSQLRQLRQNLDAQINWNNVPNTTPPLTQEITRAQAHGARGAIADNIPGAGDTARDISRLIDAKEPALKATNRMDNNNSLGLRGSIGLTTGAGIAGAGHAMDSGLMQAIGVIEAGGALLTPRMKGRIAQMIYNSKDLSVPMKRSLILRLQSQAKHAVAASEQGEQDPTPYGNVPLNELMFGANEI